MNTISTEKFDELFQKWQKLSSEVEALGAEIQKLSASLQEPVIDAPAAPEDDDLLIDIGLSPDDFEGGDFSTSLEMTKEEPLEMTEEKLVEETEEEEGKNLFGEEVAPQELGRKSRRRAPRAVYQTATAPKAVVDAMAAKVAWRIDMPGPEVRSLRSAIALGDQVLFINRLFRKDSSLYQTTIDILNNTSTLSEAIDYLSETFPEWDLESEDVYRFMMAVRRKIRK